MHKRFLLLGVLSLIIIGGIVVVQNVTSEDYRLQAALTDTECPTISPRLYPAGHYKGPLIDTHIHIPSIPDDPLGGLAAKIEGSHRPSLGVNVTIPQMACLFRTEGTTRVFGFFPVWPEIPEVMVEVVAQTMAQYPDVFTPFIMPPLHDDDPNGSPTVDAATLQRMLEISPDLFAGYGEIGLYAREGGSPELPPDDPRMLEIYNVVQAENLLVYVHLGVGHQDNLERAAAMFPDVNFIFHGDQLVEYQEDGRQNLDALEEMLDAHPNIFYGVDELYGDDFLLRPEVNKETFIAHFNDYEPLLAEDIATWKGFIERHPHQVLWGTDRGWSADWSLDTDVGLLLTDYARAFIGRLSPAVQEKFAYQNAMRLIE